MRRGFSLIALAVIVIITLILATSVTIAATSTINNSKKLAFATELKMVEDSVSSYSARNNGEFPIGQIVILDINSLVSDSSKAQFFQNNENIDNEKITLYEIDYQKCGISNLKYGNGIEGANDIYAVSLKTGKVYYIKGLKIANTTYFTITDELKSILNTGWGQADDSGIIFEPSTTQWTGEPVDMKIKIPKQYIVLDITTNTGDNLVQDVNLSNMDEMYNIYVKESTNIARNYGGYVKYKETSNSKEKIYTFEVQNVDVIEPQILGVSVSHNSNSITLNVDANDYDSGISKYYFSKDAINYYESSSNIFTFENLIENTNYSNMYVKVEDKIGNIKSWKVETVKTDSLGSISIDGGFETNSSSALIQIVYSQTPDTERYYKIDDDEWHKVAGLTEKLYIDEDCIIYAKIVDKSGQIKEVSKEIQKRE